ncbi:hypothetical protein VNI00_017038 [Paramarasmius palmivorus]|uniref:CCHC-type domain-containing protein n=1 Tax=Paramarasmius palmivorus TaxID=297713 RepID=A0AAW0B702_9AGAR
MGQPLLTFHKHLLLQPLKAEFRLLQQPHSRESPTLWMRLPHQSVHWAPQAVDYEPIPGFLVKEEPIAGPSSHATSLNKKPCSGRQKDWLDKNVPKTDEAPKESVPPESQPLTHPEEEREMVKAGRKTKAAVLLEKLKRRKEDADQLKEWEGRDVPPHLTSTQISSHPSTATMRTPSIQSTSDSFSQWINPGQSSNTLLQSPSAPPANQGAHTLAPATPGTAVSGDPDRSDPSSDDEPNRPKDPPPVIPSRRKKERKLRPALEKEINTKIAAESKIDICKLEPFSGDSRDQWRPFISTIYNIIHVKPYRYADSDRRIAMTGSYFTGKALAAYRVLVERKVKGNYVPELEDWNTFLQTFAKMFGHENEALMAWVKIGNTKQKEKESFSDFYLCFAEAAVDTGYDAITLHHLLLTHINKHFRGRLMLASQLPETYEGLVAMLRSMDATEQTFLQSGMSSPFQFFRSNPNRTTPQTSTSRFSGYTREDYNCKEMTSAPARCVNDTVQQVEEQKKTTVVGPPSLANQKPTTQQMTTRQTTFRVAGVSQEEMNRRRAAKACLICGRQGHFMVNCPDRAVTARMAYAQDEESDEPYWSIGMDGTVDFIDPGEMDS